MSRTFTTTTESRKWRNQSDPALAKVIYAITVRVTATDTASGKSSSCYLEIPLGAPDPDAFKAFEDFTDAEFLALVPEVERVRLKELADAALDRVLAEEVSKTEGVD